MLAFRDIVGQNCVSGDTRSNTIGDGRYGCSYSELPDLIQNAEQFLQDRGIGPNVCVAVECGNSLAGAVLLLALFCRGNSFLLVPPGAVEDAKPVPNFCRYRLRVMTADARDLAPFAPSRFLDVFVNTLFNGKCLPREQLLLRTSGSIGASKIVVHRHEKMLGNARNCIERYRFTSGSRAAIPVPIAHMYGFGAEFLPAVMVGASIDLQDKTNLLKYLDREKVFRPTIVFATPPICDMLLKGYKTPRTLYEFFVTSGQRIGEDLFRAFDACVGGRLINQYGSTEMGAIAGCNPQDSLDARATTIGKPMTGVDLRLVEDSTVSGGVAHLECHHPWGFEGYLDEDGEWIARVSSDGWYRTGDLASAQSDGALVVAGRADAGVNRRGYLVLLADIERQMEKLADLSEVVVISAGEENKQGTRIAAFCVLREGSAADGAQLRQRCFDLLPNYAVPDEVHVAERLPVLPSGKVDRRSLAALVR